MKKDPVVISIISLLILLAVGSIIYFNYFYVKSTGDNKEKIYVKVDDELVINEIEELIIDRKLYNIDKLKRNIDDFNTLSSKEKLNIAFDYVISNIDDVHENGIDVKKIEEYFDNTFKSIIYWDKLDLHVYNGEVYKYEKEKDIYIYDEEQSSFEVDVINSYAKIINIRNKNNIYEVTLVRLWENNDKVFTSYKDALNDINSITYSKDDIDNHLNEMTKYIYTFEKIDNNYLLVSYKYKK